VRENDSNFFKVAFAKVTASTSKNSLNPFLILDFQEDGKKISLQQLLIHTSNLLGLWEKNSLFGVKLRSFDPRVSSTTVRWKDSEIIKSKKRFLMQMYKREKIHKSG
jgi:hypothetical protein